jgi:hypothetical protein
MGNVPPKLLITPRKIRVVTLKKINFFVNTGVGISNHTDAFLISLLRNGRDSISGAVRIFGSHVYLLTAGINLQWI